MRTLPRFVCLLLMGATCLAASAGPRDPESFRRYEAMMADAEAARVRGELDEAEERFSRALDLARRWGAGNLRVARALDRLGDVARDGERWPAAAERYEAAAALWTRLFGERQPRLATTWHNLAAVYLEQERFDEARPLFRRSREIWQATRGATSAEVIISLEAEAALLQRQDRWDEATPLLEAARAARESLASARADDTHR